MMAMMDPVLQPKAAKVVMGFANLPQLGSWHSRKKLDEET